MSIDQPRQPAGVPVGGQFATSTRTETGVQLTAARPALLTPGLEELIRDELANHESMVREATRKGDDLPPDPTLGSMADSVAQMPDDIMESITSLPAAQVRGEFNAMLDQLGEDTPLDLNTLDVEAAPTCPRHGGPWGADLTCPRCTDSDGGVRPHTEGTTGAVDLDTWEPGEDVDDDALVREELVALRARVAELEADAKPADDVDAHIRAISEPAGYHPTKGVMPAVLNAIDERGEGDDWVIKHLQSDDLGDLYDEHVGPALDRVQDSLRDLVEDRTGVAQMIEQLEGMTRGAPGDFDHRSAARELFDTWGENDVDGIDYEDVWVTLRRHRED